MLNLFEQAQHALLASNPLQKQQLTKDLQQAWLENSIEFENKIAPLPLEIPGRPDKPELVAPRYLKKRLLTSTEGKAALLHAIAHIEFNAINLALDAIYRFQKMPKQYYNDWLKVAAEEAKHFGMLASYLQELDFPYGAFPAHNGLWEMALKTQQDVLVRMALVPRILEARGLDVTPGIKQKFESIQDARAIEILNIIQQEEIGHVAIGNYWYRWLCEQRQLQPLETFRQLLQKFAIKQIKKPIMRQTRIQAGFTESELDMLESYAE